MAWLDPLPSLLFSPPWAVTNAIARCVLLRSAHRLPCPVISVGNIVAGGVGKTEIAAAIAARLLAQGKRVVVASRGYGSEWERVGGVASEYEQAAALRFPDEALVLLLRAPGVAVAVGANRLAVLMRHWEELTPDVVILDDGYQHFKLARDLDVLVHDFTVRWPILRELPIVFERVPVRIALSNIPQDKKRAIGRTPWVRGAYVLEAAVGARSKEQALPREALAFCGLGNGDRFRRALIAEGVHVTGFRAFRDHMRYGESEARGLLRWQAEQNAATGRQLPLLTTLKDYVKLSPYVESQGGISGFEPLWTRLRLEFLENENVLWQAVEGVFKESTA